MPAERSAKGALKIKLDRSILFEGTFDQNGSVELVIPNNDHSISFEYLTDDMITKICETCMFEFVEILVCQGRLSLIKE